MVIGVQMCKHGCTFCHDANFAHQPENFLTNKKRSRVAHGQKVQIFILLKTPLKRAKYL
jgi:hypothetical protein